MVLENEQQQKSDHMVETMRPFIYNDTQFVKNKHINAPAIDNVLINNTYNNIKKQPLTNMSSYEWSSILGKDDLHVKSSSADLEQHMMKPDATGYEVIYGACVPYMDFDTPKLTVYNDQKEQELDHDMMLNERLEAVERMYPTGRIIIFDGSGWSDEKQKWLNSFHFLVRGVGYHKDGKDLYASLSSEIVKLTDKSVYKAEGKRQLFRMAYCAKDNKHASHLIERPFKRIQQNDAGDWIAYTLEEAKTKLGETVDDWMVTNIRAETLITGITVSSTEEKMNPINLTAVFGKMSNPNQEYTTHITVNEMPEHTRDVLFDKQIKSPTTKDCTMIQIKTEQDVRNLMSLIGYNGTNWSLETWRSIIWALKWVDEKYGIPLNALAHEISKSDNSSNYTAHEVNQYWSGKTPDNGYTLATLCKMAAKNNPKNYTAWRQSIHARADIENMTPKQLAKKRADEKKEQMNKDIYECLQSALESATEPKVIAVIKLLMSTAPSMKRFADADVAACIHNGGWFNNYLWITDDDAGTFMRFNGSYWMKDNKCSIMAKLISGDFHDEVVNISRQIFEPSPGLLGWFRERFISFKLTTAVRSIISMTLDLAPKCDNITWDTNPYLMAFENGVLNVSTGEFDAGRREDYITRNTGYEWVKGSLSGITCMYDEIVRLFERIQPIEEERRIFMKTLGASLVGRTLENFIIWTGNGRNAKDTTLNLIKAALSSKIQTGFAYNGSSTILQHELKGDLNQAIANMNLMRVIIYNEPKAKHAIDCSAIKQVTGCNSIEARGLYSKNTETLLHGTHIMVCNKIPQIDNPDDAFEKRVIIQDFRARFLTKDELKHVPEDQPYVYEANDQYKNEKWISDHRQVMIQYMMAGLKMLLDDSKGSYIMTNIPQAMQDRKKLYCQASDDFYMWWDETYERTSNDEDHETITNILKEFKTSDLFINMTKAEKRRQNRKYFAAEIVNHGTLSTFYRKTMPNTRAEDLIIRHKRRRFGALVQENIDDHTSRMEGLFTNGGPLDRGENKYTGYV